MSFIRNGSDYLNVHVIPKVRPIPTGTSGLGGARFLDEAKRDGAVPIPESVLGDLELSTAPVIPTAPITLAVFVAVTGDDAGRPASVHAEPVPVVGWRVGKDNTASPVFAFRPSGQGAMFLPVGNGQLVGPGGQLYRDLDAAKVGVRQAAQTTWDSEHGTSATVEPKVEPVEPAPVEPAPLKSVAGGRRR